MINVFSTSEQMNWLLECSKHDITLHNNWSHWSTSAGSKIAIFEILDYHDVVKQEIAQCADAGLTTICVVQELINDQVIKDFDLPNVHFYIPGYLNWQPLHATVNPYMYFFTSTVAFYKQFPDLLNIPNNISSGFDALLGRKKHHRDLVYNNVDHSANIVKYFNQTTDQDIRQLSDSQFAWPTNVLPVPDDAIDFTVNEVLVDGVIVSLSQILPTDIYANTHSSIVAETQSENAFSFYTEKIVKPILAKRPFVVASGQHYLKNLKRLGFQTFDGLIDESYDNEPLLETRIKLMCDQVRTINNMKTLDWIAQTREICEHNFQLMFDTNWQQQMIAYLDSRLSSLR